jgi:hypothetical protein
MAKEDQKNVLFELTKNFDVGYDVLFFGKPNIAKKFEGWPDLTKKTG